ncbi:MAG: tetratricopeptide repeat protein [Rhizobiales bacterium]|nr:tetratricopeptide repeat protein [Hyphomicrobiales bacterium]
MVDDNVFREVDEELRRERLEKLWEKYGTIVIGAIALLILGVAGSIWWQNQQVSKRQAAGDQFIQALRDVAKADTDKADEKFKALIESSPKGYEIMSRLHLASNLAAKGQTGEAEILYKKVTLNPSADKILRDYAKLNLAILKLENATYEETSKALSEFTKAGAIWQNTANEVVALAAFKEGKFDTAKTKFSDILTNKSTPSALKRRAQIMMDVISSRQAQK